MKNIKVALEKSRNYIAGANTYHITKVVNAVGVEADGKKYRVGDYIEETVLERLAKAPHIEITVTPSKK